MIYFIKCNEFVKIGRGAMPEDRLNTLQTGNPYKIELLGAYDGLDAEERRIHDAFVQFHHHGEWYYLSETIKAFVAKHCGRRNILNFVPRPARTSARSKRPENDNRPIGDVLSWYGLCVAERAGEDICATDLYGAYVGWCGEERYPVTSTMFGRVVKAHRRAMRGNGTDGTHQDGRKVTWYCNTVAVAA